MHINSCITTWLFAVLFYILSLSQEVTEDSRTEALQAELAAKEAEIQKLKEHLRVSIIDGSLRRNSSTQVWHVLLLPFTRYLEWFIRARVWQI